jgi:hypothetical protein
MQLFYVLMSVVILRVVLYGYEAWSLTLREEHKLKDAQGPEENICTQEG